MLLETYQRYADVSQNNRILRGDQVTEGKTFYGIFQVHFFFILTSTLIRR